MNWRGLAILILMVGFGGSGVAAPTTSYVILTNGVVGGIVAPTVKRQVLVLQDPTGSVTGWVKTLEPGVGYHYMRATLARTALHELTRSLESGGLYRLPVEEPRGGEDIYGQDTTISVYLSEKVWENGAPGSCVHMASVVKATAAQKTVFSRAVREVNGTAEGWPLSPVSEAAYQAALKSVGR